MPELKAIKMLTLTIILRIVMIEYLRRKGVETSNELGKSLLAHPYHIAVMIGDAVMLRSNDSGARIAFVDYDGKKPLKASGMTL
mgnify:CR=1 FL=1